MAFRFDGLVDKHGDLVARRSDSCHSTTGAQEVGSFP